MSSSQYQPVHENNDESVFNRSFHDDPSDILNGESTRRVHDRVSNNYSNRYLTRLVNRYCPSEVVNLPEHTDVDPRKYLGWFNAVIPERCCKMAMWPLIRHIKAQAMELDLISKGQPSYLQQDGKKLERCIYTMLYNVMFHMRLGNLGMFCVMNKNRYEIHPVFNNKPYQNMVCFKEFKTITQVFEQLGYLIPVKGFAFHRDQLHYHTNWSRIIFTDRLFNLIREFIPQLNELNMRWIFDYTRSHTRKDKPSELDPDDSEASKKEQRVLKHSRALCKKYNNFMKKHTVAEIKQTVDKSRSFINKLYIQTRRLFNRGTVECGGRFYNDFGVVQNMPKEQRKNILIDGTDTVEMDIKGTHPAMLYSMVGADMPDDPYAIPNNDRFFVVDPNYGEDVFGERAAKQRRNFIKKVMLILINAKNERQGKNAIRNILRDDRRAHREDVMQGKYYLISKIHTKGLIYAIKRFHAPIAKFFHSDIGVRLMRKDSDIVDFVMKECIRHKIPMLQVYDSFICKVKDQYILKDLVLMGWRKLFKNVNNYQLTIN